MKTAAQELALEGGAENGPRGREVLVRNGWEHFGGDYGQVRCDLRFGVVFLSGLLAKGTWSWLAQLGKKCRPMEDLTFNTNNHETSSSIAVYGNGTVKWIDGGKEHNWVSLAGIYYASTSATFAHLYTTTGWMGCSGSYAMWADARYTLVHGMCVLEGMVCRNPEITNDIIAHLPGGCRPKEYMVFHTSEGFMTQRIDVSDQTGAIIWKEGAGGNAWLSLGGIVFSVSNANQQALPLNTSSGVRWYTDHTLTEAAPPSFLAFNGFCVIQGLAAGGTGFDHDIIARLPHTCRPDRRLVFLTYTLQRRKECRVDIRTDGIIELVTCRDNPRDPRHSVTLAGIAFTTVVETLVGPIGLLGKDGHDGDRGTTGQSGGNGSDGMRGPPGPPGPSGFPGDSGPAGRIGKEGAPGILGEAAAPGSALERTAGFGGEFAAGVADVVSGGWLGLKLERQTTRILAVLGIMGSLALLFYALWTHRKK